jgi:hypothetical protein
MPGSPPRRPSLFGAVVISAAGASASAPAWCVLLLLHDVDFANGNEADKDESFLVDPGDAGDGDPADDEDSWCRLRVVKIPMVVRQRQAKRTTEQEHRGRYGTNELDRTFARGAEMEEMEEEGRDGTVRDERERSPEGGECNQ